MKEPSGPLRLLLVEDSENDSLPLLRELRRGGYEPVYERVSTPEEMERALEEASEQGRPWHVVISDYYMPRLGAPDALALLRRLGYDTPFLVVSDRIGEEAAVEMLRAGAQDYVTKENMARLCPAIERELREAEARRERERAEKALRESEERYRVVAETASDAIVVIDEGSRILFINTAAEKIFGYARAEMVGQRLTMLMPERLREVHEASLQSYLQTGRRHLDWGYIRLPGLHKSGEEIPLEISFGEFVRDGEHFFTGFVRDITERKEAEKMLREAETRYRTLVEQIPAVTYIQEPLESSDPKAITYMSPQYETMLGYPRKSEVIDEGHWLRILHPEDRERVLAEEARTDDTGEPFRVEYRVIAKDGRVVWVRDHATLVRDEEGRPLYWLGVQHDITDLKRAQQELNKSEERYRTFIEQSTEGIWRFELEEPVSPDLPEDEQIERFYRHAYLAECNDAMAGMYGYECAEQIVGARLGDLLPRSIPDNVEYLEAFVRSGYSLTDVESHEVDREGNAKYFLNNLTGIVEAGLLVRAWGTQRDVTDRKEAEEALRASEERFRATFEQAAVGVAHVSLEGRWLRVNQKLCEIVGYSGEELLRLTFQDITHRDDLETDLEQARRLLAGEIGTYSREKRYVKKDGSIVWINLTVSLGRDPNGEYFITVIEDISERKKAEEERSRLAAIVESSHDAILGKTLDGTITSWNRAAERLYGYSVEEAVGRPVTMLVPPDRPEEVPEILRKVRRGEKVERLETVRVSKDGRHFDVSLTVSPIINQEGDIVGASTIARDITEHKRAEEALRDVREAERNRIARDLHDDILQDIVYALQEIQIVQVVSEDGGATGLEEAAEALRRSVEGLRGAIFELRQRETLGRSFVASLEDLLDLNRRMARRSYELELIVEDGFPRVLSEKASRELVRIVQEALANVRRHSGARHARVRLWREGDLAYVEVADDGSGFDAENPGVGVGLQSMRHRALELGGELEVESRPGRGTRVRFAAAVSRLTGG